MLELLPETAGNVIAVKVYGTITATDYEEFMPSLEGRIADAAPAIGLVDWEELDGWAADAKWYSFWYRVTNRRAFTRVAVIARENWHGEVETLSKLLDQAKVRRFEPRDRAAAWDWLRGPADETGIVETHSPRSARA